MPPSQQVPVNWTAIGVIVALFVGILTVIIGVIVARAQSKRREQFDRQQQLRRAASDFEVIVNKWIAAIADKGQRLPKGWGITLRGPLDLYAQALEQLRTSSVTEIAPDMRTIRSFLSATGKISLDKEWRDYQEYTIDGIDEKDPNTGQEFTNHSVCKSGLIGCLERMKKITGESL